MIIRFNIHGKWAIFNVNFAANGRKSAHPALRLPKNPVWKLKKKGPKEYIINEFCVAINNEKGGTRLFRVT